VSASETPAASAPPPDPGYVVPLERTLDGVLGFEILELADTTARGQVVVDDRIRQRWGLVHGGAYAAMAELVATEATIAAVAENDQTGVGLANHSSFLRPVERGTVHAHARRKHRGRSTWVWEVDFLDDDDRLCCTTRVTIAIVPRTRGRR